MKKHFLLLVMALMSMTAWAVDFDPSDFQVTNVTYGGSTNPTWTTGYPKLAGSNFTIDFTKWYTDQACTTIAKDDKGVAYTISTLPVGKYYLQIVGQGSTYAGLTTFTSFNVLGQELSISFEAKTQEYGDDAQEITYKVYDGTDEFDNSKNVLGLTVGREAGDAVKEYDFTYSWTNKNYVLTRIDANKYTITKKDLTGVIAIALGDEALTYTGSNQTPTITVSAGSKTLTATTDYTLSYKFSDAEDGSYAATTNLSQVGWYKVTATPAGNYSGTAITADPYEIAKAPLSVYVNNYDKEYDGTDGLPSDFTFGYSGLVGADAGLANPFGTSAFTVSYKSATGNEYKLGSYSLAIAKDAPTGDYESYDVTFLTTGKLNVVPKKITVKPADATATKAYSDPDPDFQVDASGAIGYDSDNIADAYTVTRTNAGTEAVGVYKGVLTLSKKSDLYPWQEAILANYDITLATNDFTITAAELYVYPKNVTITYGATIPEFEVVAQNSSGTAVTLTKTPTVKYKEAKYNTEAPKNQGTYVLVLDGDAAAEGFKTVNKLEGQLVINKRALTITPKAQSLHVGDKVTDLDQSKVTYSGDGLVAGDVIGYELAFNTDATDGGIATTNFKDGDATKALLAGAENTYDKGIKVSKLVASTTEKPNQNDNYTITYADQFGKLAIGAETAVFFLSTDDDWIDIVKYGEDAVVENVQLTPARSQAISKFDGKWKAGEWNTLILPFAVKARDISRAFGYAIVNVVNPDKTTTGKVAFTLKMDKTEIPANTPIAVKTDEDIAVDAVIDFGSVKVVKPADKIVTVDAGAGHKFVGVYETVTIDKNTPNYHFMVNGSWKHIGATSSNTYKIIPFNCYVDQSAASAARELTFTFEEIDGSTTAIRAISVDKDEDSESVKTGWYTIGGMKLQGAPAQKGIYIHNGKKIVVK